MYQFDISGGKDNEKTKHSKINIDYFYAAVSGNHMVFVPVFDHSGSNGGYCVRKLYCVCLSVAWFYLFRENVLRLALSYGRHAGMFIFS